MIQSAFDLEYVVRDGVPLLYDFFRPDNHELAPLLVFIHGGGWISGDRLHLREEAIWAAEHGFAAAAISYRIAPMHPFPAAVDDALEFVRHARRNAGKLRIDPERIAAIGSSAGGHLASMCGLSEGFESTEPGGNVKLVVDICGITDLRDARNTHLPIAWSFLEQFLGCRIDEHPERWAAASPITHVKAGKDVTFVIAHGAADDVVPIEQSRRFHVKLEECGIDSVLIEFAGEGHSFSWDAWLETRKAYMSAIERVFGAQEVRL